MKGVLLMNEKEKIEAEHIDALLSAKQNMVGSDFSTFMSSNEAKLASTMLELGTASKPSPEFVQSLEKRLAIESSQQNPRLIGRRNLFKGRGLFTLLKRPGPIRLVLIAVGTLIVALLAYFGPPLLKTGEAARLPSLSGSSQGVIGGGSTFEGTEFILQTNLPVVPSNVSIYQQPAPKELTLAQVRSLAGRFGFTGAVYQQKLPELPANSSSSQNGFPTLPTFYTLFDGQRRIQITNQGFEYSDTSIPESVWSQSPLPYNQIESIARQYLESHGLLDFSYRTLLDPNSANVIEFEVLADQWPIVNLKARVVIAPDGRIASISYPLINFTILTKYPIHSANDAWNALQSGATPGKWMQMSVSNPPGANYKGPLEIWGPEYAPIQYVEITGSVSVYLPVKGENVQPMLDLGPGSPRLEVSDKDLQDLIDSNYRLLLLWGKLQLDDSGGLIFEVAGWKDASQVEMKNIQGAIVREQGRVLLRQADGQVFLLPLAPKDIPNDISVSVSAWDTNRFQDGYPELGWSTIETPPQPAAAGNPQSNVISTPENFLPTAENSSAVSVAISTSSPVTVVVTTQVPQVTVQPGNPTESSPLSGKVYIDKVELVYVVTPTDFQSRTPAASVIQPAWRFSGYTESGAKFEILLQAVLEKYLK
jgi:hypothetical protein